MADVFTSPDSFTSPVGVSAPFLTGNFIPAIDIPQLIDARGLVVPWGGGLMARRFADLGEITAGPTQAEQIAEMAAAMISPSQIVNYNFEGLIGPAGPMGQPGPPGVGVSIPGQPGVSGTAITADMPITRGITFADAGAGKVTWSTGTLRYKGVDYTIAVEATGDTNEYIYWDKDSTPTSFLTTATLANVIGLDKWLMCYNDGGTPQLASQNKVLHGGYIKASTIDTVNLNALSITTAKINNLDVTTGKVAANAITKQAYTYTAADIAISGGDNTVQTVSFTTTGSDLLITASILVKLNSGATLGDLKVQLLRDANIIYDTGRVQLPGNAAGAAALFCCPMMTEAPSADTYSYTINVYEHSNIVNVANRFLRVVELKK